jgi:hypothetical protein
MKHRGIVRVTHYRLSTDLNLRAVWICVILFALLCHVSCFTSSHADAVVPVGNHMQVSVPFYYSQKRVAGCAGARSRKKLLLVLPITNRDIPDMRANLNLWASHGPVCTSNSRGNVDLWILHNKGPADLPRGTPDLTLMPELQPHAHCFGEIKSMFANLTGIEDSYPAGPSNMFFKILLHPPLQNLACEYNTMFWMEEDVMPVKQLWIDKLFAESLDGDFWMKGSMYRGKGLDSSVLQSQNWDWIGHINGNALYRLNDPEFTQFLRVVVNAEPPNHYWKPFDVSIWKVLHDFPYNWRIHQHVIRRFVYSDFIQHWGFSSSEEDVAVSNESRRTILRHGKQTSAGIVKWNDKFGKRTLDNINWDGSIDKTDNVSVVIVSGDSIRKTDLALESALMYVAGASQIVVIVSMAHRNAAEELMRKYGKPPHVQIVVIPGIRPGNALHHAYAHLIAYAYCKGEFILHLETDAVFTRKLYRKDLMFMGRPIVHYGPAENHRNLQRRFASETPKLATLSPFDFSGARTLIVPRAVFVDLRSHIMRVFNMSIATFLSKRPDIRSSIGRRPADNDDPTELRLVSNVAFNIIGAFLWNSNRTTVWWRPTGELENQLSYLLPIVPSFVCKASVSGSR